MSISTVGFSLYPYNPNAGAPIALAVLFITTVVTHTIRSSNTSLGRSPVLCPGVAFTAGFIMCEISIHNDKNLGILIASQVLLITAPLVYALTNYLLLGRTLFYVPYLFRIDLGHVISTFDGLDVVVEILTGNGAGEPANLTVPSERHTIGLYLIRASLLLQFMLFLGFTLIEVLFHVCCI